MALMAFGLQARGETLCLRNPLDFEGDCVHGGPLFGLGVPLPTPTSLAQLRKGVSNDIGDAWIDVVALPVNRPTRGRDRCESPSARFATPGDHVASAAAASGVAGANRVRSGFL